MELGKFSASLIFGTVDLQGFMIGNKFNVVELAFKRSDRKEADCYLFRPSLPFNKLTSKYKVSSGKQKIFMVYPMKVMMLCWPNRKLYQPFVSGMQKTSDSPFPSCFK